MSSDTGHFHTLNEAVQGSVAGENPQQETGDLYLEEDFELEEVQQTRFPLAFTFVCDGEVLGIF